MLWDAESTVVSRDEIAEVIWPDDIQTAVSDQAIDALVRRLRERIAELDPETTYISNVRGFGFRLQNQAT